MLVVMITPNCSIRHEWGSQIVLAEDRSESSNHMPHSHLFSVYHIQTFFLFAILYQKPFKHVAMKTAPKNWKGGRNDHTQMETPADNDLGVLVPIHLHGLASSHPPVFLPKDSL